MSRIDNELFYKNALKKYGTTPRGLNWHSNAHQQIRFDVITSFLPKSGFSVVDVGCGFGDFYFFLRNNQVDFTSYTGVDVMKEMCEITQKRTSCEVLHVDVLKAKLPKADFYVCSGALNILSEFETFLFLKNCFSSSKKGFIFNALYGSKKSDVYNYLTKQTITQFANDLGVSRVEFRDDYMQNDITVGFFKLL